MALAIVEANFGARHLLWSTAGLRSSLNIHRVPTKRALATRLTARAGLFHIHEE